MLSEAIPLANCKMLGWVHQDTGQNSTTINTTRGRYASFSATKNISSSISRSICLIMEVWVLWHLSPPLHFHIVFAKIVFAKLKFAIESRKYTGLKIRESYDMVSGLRAWVDCVLGMGWGNMNPTSLSPQVLWFSGHQDSGKRVFPSFSGK